MKFLKSILRPFFVKIIRSAVMVHANNIELGRHLHALKTTVEFVEREMPLTKAFHSKEELLLHCLRNELKSDEGLVLEFGVFHGGTINKIAAELKQTIHGFDSFEGLPDFWRNGFEKGSFAVDSMPRVRENVVLVKGWFDQTLGPFLEHERGSG